MLFKSDIETEVDGVIGRRNRQAEACFRAFARLGARAQLANQPLAAFGQNGVDHRRGWHPFRVRVETARAFSMRAAVVVRRERGL